MGGGDVGGVTLPIITIFSNATRHHTSCRRGTQTCFTQKARNPYRTSIIRVILCYIEFGPLGFSASKSPGEGGT